MQRLAVIIGLIVALFLLVIIPQGTQSRSTGGPINLPPGDDGPGGGPQMPDRPRPLSGYAWSPQIGWVSFSNGGSEGAVNYGVTLNQSLDIHRRLSGYAWSPLIGYIRFNENLALSDGMPAYPTSGAYLDITSRKMDGWGRACVVYANEGACSGTLKSSAERGGWDGWIKFGGSTQASGTYNVEVDAVAPTTALDGSLSYAWGEDIVGWLDPCGVAGNGTPYCIKFGVIIASCSVPGEDANGNSSVGQVTWHGAASGGSGDNEYQYVWSTGPGGTGTVLNPTTPDNPDYIATYTAPDDLGLQTLYLRVTDAGGASGDCTASTNIVDQPGSGVGDEGGDLVMTEPQIMRINSQPLTSPAISSPATFRNQAPADGGNATVVINSSLGTLATCLLLWPNEILASDSLGWGSCNGLNRDLLPGDTGRLFIKTTRADPALTSGSPFDITITNSSHCVGGVDPDGDGPLPPPCVSQPQIFHALFDYAAGTVKSL